MKVFTTGQVAKICKVAPRTVSKWFDSGRLKGYRIPGSQDRRIPREYLIKFLKEHGKIVLAEFGYGGKLLPSFPKWLLDGTQPTRAAWFLKDRMLPAIYWHFMLKGREYLAKPHIYNKKTGEAVQ